MRFMGIRCDSLRNGIAGECAQSHLRLSELQYQAECAWVENDQTEETIDFKVLSVVTCRDAAE